MSLRLKLTLWISALALVIHLTLSVAILLYQRMAVQDFFDTRFHPRLAGIVARARAADFRFSTVDWESLAHEFLAVPAGDPYFAALYRLPGVLEVATPGKPPSPAEVASWLAGDYPHVVRRGSGLEIAGAGGSNTQTRTFVEKLYASDGSQHALVVMVSDVPAASVLSVLSSVLLMTIPAGVLAAGVSGYLISGLITRPLLQLRRLAGSLSPDQLDRPMAVQQTVPELAQLQAELEESRTRLRAALVSHDRFISNVSHELKTPVAVVLTEAQTIDRSGLAPDQARFIDSVMDEMRRLGRMVESFLTLTRVRAGKSIANAERCDLNDVVMKSIENCSNMSRQQSVYLEPVLLDSPRGAEIFGDAELLRIMVDNLVRNAIRFSPAGGAVVVSVEGGDLAWVVRVRDEGPGIPAEMMDSLFDRFTQASTEVVRGRGYGLGLSIAQGIAELHAGVIEVHNLEVGCEFVIRLPRGAGTDTTVFAGSGALGK